MTNETISLERYITKSDIQEALVALYLRLNGFLTTGFIVHSPQSEGRRSNRTEIDIIGVRFPYNAEPAREILPSEYLDVSLEEVDIIIAEVKSGGEHLQFNRELRQYENLYTVLQWVGAFHPGEIDDIVNRMLPQLEPREINSPDHRIIVSSPSGRRVRAILFHTDRPAIGRNTAFFVGSHELMGFIWNCFRPSEPRMSSQTRYDFTRWGPLYEPIVRYFKDESLQEPGNVDDVIRFVYAWIESKITVQT